MLAIKSHMVLFGHSLEAQDVGNALGVIPHSSVAREVPNHACGASSGVASDVHTGVRLSDVLEQVGITKQIDGGLVVQQQPGGWDVVGAGLRK